MTFKIKTLNPYFLILNCVIGILILFILQLVLNIRLGYLFTWLPYLIVCFISYKLATGEIKISIENNKIIFYKLKEPYVGKEKYIDFSTDNILKIKHYFGRASDMIIFELKNNKKQVIWVDGFVSNDMFELISYVNKITNL